MLSFSFITDLLHCSWPIVKATALNLFDVWRRAGR